MSNAEDLLSGPLGIASSCLTEDINCVKKLISPLLDSPYADVLGWVTVKTICAGTGERHSRIVHSGNCLARPVLPRSLICRGTNEWLDHDQVASLTRGIRDWFVSRDRNISIKISLEEAPPESYIDQIGRLHQHQY